MKANSDIREVAKNMDVYLWEVAEALKMQDSGLSRKLRRELSKAEKEKLITVIKAVAAEKGKVNE